MKHNFKIVAVTPAGRSRYMEILRAYIYKNKHILDRWDLWVNTNNPSDISYLHELKNSDPTFINLIESKFTYNTWGHPNLNISPFWDNATDEDSIYIRFDDDVVFIADGTIESIIDFRVNNQNHLFVYPFIINNIHHSRNLQDRNLVTNELGMVRHEDELFGQGIYDPVGLMSPQFVYELHKTFFNHYYNNSINQLMVNEPIIWKYKSQISINCVCWYGSLMKQLTPLKGGHWPVDEENFMTTELAEELQMPLVTVPGTLICHYLFGPQRTQGEMIDILHEYSKIANV